MSGKILNGGCDCGALRYRLEGRPMFVHCCHCRWCQRESGSAFALNAIYETDRVVLLDGRAEIVGVPTASGAGQTFHRCPVCKVALWSHYAVPGIDDRVAFVRVGTLDDPDSVRPDVHIWTMSKQPWLNLDDRVPVFERYYRWHDVWPPESLTRVAALRRG